MAQFKVGDMWSAFKGADLFLITTNSFIKNDGRLVMGAGIAKQARDRYKGLDLALGRRIDHMGTYGLLVSENWPESKLGAFQVKWHFKDEADLGLIGYSVYALRLYIEYNAVLGVHMNFPGIGNGRLNKEQVLPILKTLPNNVTIWEYET